jgi:hypothetical protein
LPSFSLACSGSSSSVRNGTPAKEGGSRKRKTGLAVSHGKALQVVFGRNPAVAVAEDAQKARESLLQNFVADVNRVLFLGDAPPQVHLFQMQSVRQEFRAQPREHAANQNVPLGLGVFKRR